MSVASVGRRNTHLGFPVLDSSAMTAFDRVARNIMAVTRAEENKPESLVNRRRRPYIAASLVIYADYLTLTVQFRVDLEAPAKFPVRGRWPQIRHANQELRPPCVR